jgi:hypothetical protein
LTAILQVIDEINGLDINKVYNEMQPILEHNYNVFKNLSSVEFQKLVND